MSSVRSSIGIYRPPRRTDLCQPRSWVRWPGNWRLLRSANTGHSTNAPKLSRSGHFWASNHGPSGARCTELLAPCEACPLLHPIQRSDLEQILADDHQSSEVSARRVDPHLIRNGGVVRWDKM